jgi:hypothetical protein
VFDYSEALAFPGKSTASAMPAPAMALPSCNAKPLGNPSANGKKFFATADLLEQVNDRAWLVKVTSAINLHCRKNNAGKQNHVNHLALPYSS